DQGAFMAPLRWAVPLACRAAAQWSTPTRAQARDILILPTTPEPRRTGGAQNGARPDLSSTPDTLRAMIPALPSSTSIRATTPNKGTGSRYLHTAENTETTLEGRSEKRGEARLEFDPGNTASDDAGIAVKHVHSGDHPEADWGRHVLAAIQLGLDMLNDALPD